MFKPKVKPRTMNLNNLCYTCLILLLIACGSDDENPTSSSTVENASPTEGFTSEQTVTDDEGSVYTIGYEQVTSNNQDPFIEKTGKDGEVIWRLKYEETPVDGKGEIIALLGDKLWAVFTVDGGSNDDEYITSHQTVDGAFLEVYLNSYGRGGGPAVSVLCQINPKNGQIIRGTFLRAELNNGNTNTKRIRELAWVDGKLGIRATSAAWPAGAGTRFEQMEDITNDDRIDGTFYLYYEMSSDLSTITSAEILSEAFD